MSTLAHDVAQATHRFQLEYGCDPNADQLVTFLRMEDQQAAKEKRAKGEQARFLQEEIARLEAMDNARYVRVRFSRYGALYTYECRNAKVGDYVVVPPNCVTSEPQLLKVLELGCGAKYGQDCRQVHRNFRPAHLVPRPIATGADLGSAGR